MIFIHVIVALIAVCLIVLAFVSIFDQTPFGELVFSWSASLSVVCVFVFGLLFYV